MTDGKKTPRHLVMRLGHLGDVVLVTGVLRYFSERWHCSFDVLTRKEWAPLFYHNPHIGRLIEVEKWSLRGGPLWRFLRSLANEYTTDDTLYDVHGVLRSRLLGGLWPGQVRRYDKLGLERRAFMLSHGRIGGGRLRQSSVLQRYAKAFSDESLPEHLLLPQLYVTEEERATARARLAQYFPLSPNTVFPNKTANLVALHPFATHQNKAWPERHWLELINRLEAKNIPWIVIGATPAEQARAWEGKNSFVNQTSLREVMALLEQAQVVVTGDSGPLHLARGVKTQVVGLFGPTVKEWGFFPTDEEGIILETPRSCRPCSLHGAKPCSHASACLNDIGPAHVFEAVRGLLARQPGAK